VEGDLLTWAAWVATGIGKDLPVTGMNPYTSYQDTYSLTINPLTLVLAVFNGTRKVVEPTESGVGALAPLALPTGLNFEKSESQGLMI
jgi:hypothetical protein